jgi:hypothetical protein
VLSAEIWRSALAVPRMNAALVALPIQPAARPMTSTMQQEPSSVAMEPTSKPISITVAELYLITEP